ncbi:MAG TPA: hypothetical protein PK536_04220 [Ignavibacteria bacterium]|nr:hypothetical protein [Bacteroidota bacterium]HRI84633.1 hypothetical protein [Ignavibacteria bacterium]
MKDTRLIELLKSFSPEEMSGLEKYISSPFFSRKRDVAPIFKTVKKFYPDFDSDDLTNENIYHKLFPGKKFGDKKSDNLIRTLTSELLRSCKDFLAYVEFGSDENRKKFYLLNQLRRKKNYREFDKEYSSLINEDFKDGGEFVQTLMEKYFIKSVYMNYSLNRDRFDEAFHSMMKTREYSVVAALVNSFKFENEKLLATGYNLKVGTTAVDSLINNTDAGEILEDMKKNNSEFYPYVFTFYLVYKMNREKNGNEYYFKLKKHLNDYLNLFSRSDQYMFYSILATYCSSRTDRAEKDSFREELFEIYDNTLKNGIYKILDKEDIHIVLFRNIVNNAAQLKKFDWLEKFIEKYSAELHKDHRENMTFYALANLFYEKGEYEKSLEQILKIKFDLFLYKLDIRILLMKIYYELNYSEQAFSLYDSFLNYLKSAKNFPDHTKISGINFLKYTKMLMRIKEKEHISSDDLKVLSHKLKEENHVLSFDWLSEKINQLNLYVNKKKTSRKIF